MMSAMVQGGQLSPQDIDELMRMLEKAREELKQNETSR